jgi:hypothetical protein
MHLIEILLPLDDNSGKPFDRKKYADIRKLLTERFGGVTAFMRAPAHGTTSSGGRTVHDDIAVFEVMTASLDAEWWKNYRMILEQDFGQEDIVVRVSSVTLL